MAVVGESECREVAPCAAGDWGDLPVQGDTQYVDGAYAGTDSVGTMDRPWRTIQAGIDAASAGAIVAVAAGSYPQDLRITGQPVRLWGRCPGLVEVVGGVVAPAAIEIGPGASGAEVRGLALRGGALGLLVHGAENVLLATLWVHDTAMPGIYLNGDTAATSVVLQDPLVEAAQDVGILMLGAQATVDRLVVRDTLTNAAALGSPSHARW